MQSGNRKSVSSVESTTEASNTPSSFAPSSSPPTSAILSPTSLEYCANCGGRTFPTSLGQDSVNVHSDTANEITKALRSSRSRESYQRVSVLTLRWDTKDAEWEKESVDLRNVLESKFKYATFDYEIPLTPHAQGQLMTRILKFTEECGGQDNLLIIYYGGHGHMGRGGRCIWTAEIDPDQSFSLDWSRIQPWLFEDYRGDVLLLLDCCHAGSAARGDRPETKHILAACRAGSVTNAYGPHTFTKQLLKSLADKYDEFKDAGFSIEELRVSLHAVLPTEPLSIVVTGRYPIYLRPIRGNNNRNFEPRDPACGMQISRKSTRYPKALLSFHFSGDMDSLKPTLLRWLGDQAPPGISDITVEGFYQSSSSLVLVSVPVRTWATLPDHPSISFIGLTTSENQVDTLRFMTPSRPPHREEMYNKRNDPDLESGLLKPENTPSGPSKSFPKSHESVLSDPLWAPSNSSRKFVSPEALRTFDARTNVLSKLRIPPGISITRPQKYSCITQKPMITNLAGSASLAAIQVGFESIIPRWKPGQTITFAVFADGYPEPELALLAANELKEAADAWNSFDIGVQFRWVPNIEDASFVLLYAGSGQPGALAEAFFPNPTCNLNSLYVFRAAFEPGTVEYLKNIFLHELAHILGLRHEFAQDKGTAKPEEIGVDNPQSVMACGFPPQIQESDIEMARKFYQGTGAKPE